MKFETPPLHVTGESRRTMFVLTKSIRKSHHFFCSFLILSFSYGFMAHTNSSAKTTKYLRNQKKADFCAWQSPPLLTQHKFSKKINTCNNKQMLAARKGGAKSSKTCNLAVLVSQTKNHICENKQFSCKFSQAPARELSVIQAQTCTCMDPTSQLQLGKVIFEGRLSRR